MVILFTSIFLLFFSTCNSILYFSLHSIKIKIKICFRNLILFFTFFVCYRSKRFLCLTEVKSRLPSDLYKNRHWVTYTNSYAGIFFFFCILNIYLITLCLCIVKLKSSDMCRRTTKNLMALCAI